MSLPIPQDNLSLPTGRIAQSWQRFLQLLVARISDVAVYTPNVFASSGVITTVSTRARYQKIGNQVVLNGAVTVTNNGTGAGFLFVSLPTAIALPTEQTVGTCIQGAGGGAPKAMLLLLGDQVGGAPFNPAYQALVIRNTDGTYPTAGTIINFSIVYWVN